MIADELLVIDLHGDDLDQSEYVQASFKCPRDSERSKPH
jgi:hypothetical protein